MNNREISICYAIWDTSVYQPDKAVADLMQDLNFALDSTIVPIVDPDIMSAIRWAAHETGYTHLVVYNSGTVLNNMYIADTHWHAHCQSDWLVSGHIMKRPTDDYPWLHEQTIAINLEQWKRCGEPDIGDYESGEKYLPSYAKSADNIHDDYTPLWIKPSSAETITTTRRKFGWNLIAASLDNGLDIVNIPIQIRKTKFFIYPSDNGTKLAAQVQDLRTYGHTDQLPLENSSQNKLTEQIKWFMDSANNSAVFVFNTGDGLVNKELYPSEIPDAIWTTASGFKSFAEWQYRGMPEHCQINTYDFNPLSLDLWKSVHRNWSGRDMWAFMLEHDAKCVNDGTVYCWGNKIATETKQEACHRQEHELAELFGGPDAMQAAWQKFISLDHRYHLCNLIEEPMKLVHAIDPCKKHFMWLNNVFYFRRSILVYGINRLGNSLMQLVSGINDRAADSVLHGQCAQIYFQNRPAQIIHALQRAPIPKYQCDMHWTGESYKNTYPKMR